MSKKSCFRRLFEKQRGKRAQALFKSASQHLDHIYRSLPRKLSWKNSLLLTCKILGLLVNTMAADKTYIVLDRVNLATPIQMELSQKKKTFSAFFTAFLKSILNFEHFELKRENHSFCISGITESEKVVR